MLLSLRKNEIKISSILFLDHHWCQNLSRKYLIDVKILSSVPINQTGVGKRQNILVSLFFEDNKSYNLICVTRCPEST